MRNHTMTFFVLAALALMLVPSVAAHSPLGTSDNESLATAMVIPEPTKSWAIYAELHEGGEAQYYRFDMVEGVRIYVSLFGSPAMEDRGFTPSLVIMGPGIPEEGIVPDFVERPNGSGARVSEGVWPAQATYEPFAPSVFYPLAEFDAKAPATGSYVVAVFGIDRGGRYGLAIGTNESFTATEWISTPFALLGVYAWEGQSLAVVLAPAVLVFGVGLALLWRRGLRRMVPQAGLGAVAGLLYIGSAAVVLAQAALAASVAPAGGGLGITLMFVALPLVLGLAVLRVSLTRSEAWDRKGRVYMVVLALLGVVFWAGYFLGPAIAVLAAALPQRAPVPAAEAPA